MRPDFETVRVFFTNGFKAVPAPFQPHPTQAASRRVDRPKSRRKLTTKKTGLAQNVQGRPVFNGADLNPQASR